MNTQSYMKLYNIMYVYFNPNLVGGYCFLPESTSEGMTIFEMEVVLSIRKRARQKLECEVST